MGITPLSFPLIHRSFNWYRSKHVKSADRESGHTYLQDRPISQQTVTPEPKKTQKALASEPTPQPQTEAQPAPKEEEG